MADQKNIILGVCGSIAAYKSAYLTRLLVKEGYAVQPVLTRAAAEFVTPLTFATLSGRQALVEFTPPGKLQWNNHVELGLWADLMLIAPASANTLAKMARGLADNLLLTVYLSCRAPVAVAPAMDHDMWHHPATQKNLEILRQHGVEVIEVDTGELVSGLTGEGRMAEPERLLDWVNQFLSGPKKKSLDKKVVVTAGPTVEAIDAVRFISNRSTGKMGIAIAEAYARHGCSVTLILGPTPLQPAVPGIQTVRVTTAEEMFHACRKYFPGADIFVSAAAVADFTPARKSPEKTKKGKASLNLELKPTTDILKTLSKSKKPGQLLVGFAMETGDLLEEAARKLKGKNLDLIIANSIREPGAGFGSDTNRVTFIDRNNKITKFELKPKSGVAEDIVEYTTRLLNA